MARTRWTGEVQGNGKPGYGIDCGYVDATTPHAAAARLVAKWEKQLGRKRGRHDRIVLVMRKVGPSPTTGKVENGSETTD